MGVQAQRLSIPAWVCSLLFFSLLPKPSNLPRSPLAWMKKDHFLICKARYHYLTNPCTVRLCSLGFLHPASILDNTALWYLVISQWVSVQAHGSDRPSKASSPLLPRIGSPLYRGTGCDACSTQESTTTHRKLPAGDLWFQQRGFGSLLPASLAPPLGHQF